ncbi:hypothetical protein AB0J35_41155 [Nonomuraea angiospora]|uniref:hypothetical protein n=1 Tax=Nonomuraea angiospora TaxID=46172 RepID=UPI00343D08AA
MPPARDLRDRLHLTEMVARVARVEAVACDSVHEAAWLVSGSPASNLAAGRGVGPQSRKRLAEAVIARRNAELAAALIRG